MSTAFGLRAGGAGGPEPADAEGELVTPGAADVAAGVTPPSGGASEVDAKPEGACDVLGACDAAGVLPSAPAPPAVG